MTAQPIFVVGCPRSGTSPFAHWLAACGLRTAEDERRLDGYPSGFYEHVPILMFHKSLERLSRRADHAVRLEPILTSDLLRDPYVDETFRLAFAPLFEGRFAFLKFPQLALSIDFLFEQFPRAHVVALWRRPDATFRSLVTREFPPETIPASGVKAVLLWNLYACHLERAAARRPADVSLVCIDDFLREPAQATRLLARVGHEGKAASVAETVDTTRWSTEVSLPWRLYWRAMRGACRLLERRLGPERGILADQRRWQVALRRATDAQWEGTGRVAARGEA